MRHDPTTILSHRASPRLLVALGLLWLGIVGVLFAWTGRFSLAAVLDACGTEAPDVLFAPGPPGPSPSLPGAAPLGFRRTATSRWSTCSTPSSVRRSSSSH